MATPLLFYFDFTSTFSYIAAQKIDALAAKYGRDVDWIAVSLGHLFVARKITPPPLDPPKFKYLRQDFPRSCAMHGLPARLPEEFPPQVKLARLYFWRLKRRDEKLAHDYARALSMAIFGRGEKAATAAEIAAICKDTPGIDAADISAASEDAQAKSDVVAALDQALADGMIGAPFMVLDGEPFWGADRLDHLERRLAGG